MGDHFPQSTPKMRVVCLLALLVACVSAGPRPDKREADIDEFGVVDTVVDSIKNKILDAVKGQLTEENVERFVEYIKDKVDGGDWVDAVIDFLGDLVTQDVLDSVIDFIEEKLMGDQGTPVYKREAEIAEFGVVDTVVDSIKNKILDVVKGQLTEENIERLVDYIKEKVDGGDWADAVIDLLGDQGTAVYDLSDSAADALVKVLGKILDVIPDAALDKIYEKVCPGCPL